MSNVGLSGRTLAQGQSPHEAARAAAWRAARCWCIAARQSALRRLTSAAAPGGRGGGAQRHHPAADPPRDLFSSLDAAHTHGGHLTHTHWGPPHRLFTRPSAQLVFGRHGEASADVHALIAAAASARASRVWRDALGGVANKIKKRLLDSALRNPRVTGGFPCTIPSMSEGSYIHSDHVTPLPVLLPVAAGGCECITFTSEWAEGVVPRSVCLCAPVTGSCEFFL